MNVILKKYTKIILSMMLIIITLSESAMSTAYAITESEDKSKITVTSESTIVNKGKKIQLYADVDNVSWSSSDSGIAKVDNNGLVKGVSTGKAIITATNGRISGSIEINVTVSSKLALNFLSKHALFSYKYSYKDDYFYVDSPNAWQKNFGFNKAYDLVAPYILLEYDYARVHFEYEGKDWMIQLWKGQYGMVFYGGEVGVYCKEHSDEEDKVFTTYKCAGEEDWLQMQTSLYRDEKLNGNYVHEFSTDYETTWWSTGFKPGHLWVQEPAKELRLTGTITLKDAEMTKAFVNGLKECGFSEVEKSSAPPIDSFYVDGCNVVYSWQNLSDAENTMPIKIAGSALMFINFVGLLFGFLTFLSMGTLAMIILL